MIFEDQTVQTRSHVATSPCYSCQVRYLGFFGEGCGLWENLVSGFSRFVYLAESFPSGTFRCATD